MSGNEEDKKSFWEEFFETVEEEPPQKEEGVRVPIRNEDEDLMSILEGKKRDPGSFDEVPIHSSEENQDSEETHFSSGYVRDGDEETPLSVKEGVEAPEEPLEYEESEDISIEGPIPLPDYPPEEEVRLPVKEEDDNLEESPSGEDEEGNLTQDEAGNLYEAPAGQYFYIHNGPTLKNLYDLEYYLGTMTDDQFKYHAVGGRNDFASWIRDVLGEDKLASEFERVRERKEMHDILARFLSLK
jgi:hypothetical protein